MLYLHLEPILQARGIDKPFTWLRKLGFTHNTAHRLLHQPKVIELSYLAKLCRALNCTPNDILAYTAPSDAPALPAGHPLLKLAPKAGPGNLQQLLGNLTADELEQFWQQANNLRKDTGGQQA